MRDADQLIASDGNLVHCLRGFRMITMPCCALWPAYRHSYLTVYAACCSWQLSITRMAPHRPLHACEGLYMLVKEKNGLVAAVANAQAPITSRPAADPGSHWHISALAASAGIGNLLSSADQLI